LHQLAPTIACCDVRDLDDYAAARTYAIMVIQITSSTDPGSTEAERSILTAMLRGARHLCPACGRGRLFARYLKVADTCPSCATELHHHRADDAPPYFTILVVGHLVVAGILSVEMALSPQPWVQALIWLPITLVLSLTLLPRFKGALIGLQWALRMHGFGEEPDPSEATLSHAGPVDPSTRPS
jgi:uncharacterized protein (DUF983 family)